MKDQMKRIHAGFLRREGRTYQEIAAKLSVPKSTIARWLRKQQLDPLTKISMESLRFSQLEDARAVKAIKKTQPL